MKTEEYENKVDRKPITCKKTGKLLARVDTEKQLLYLWCKQCKAWEEQDIEVVGKPQIQH